MSPPIDIDGSEIQRATIDGEDVSEITIDGQQTAGFVDIPDSVVSRPDDSGSFRFTTTLGMRIETSQEWSKIQAEISSNTGSMVNAYVTPPGEPSNPYVTVDVSSKSAGDVVTFDVTLSANEQYDIVADNGGDGLTFGEVKNLNYPITSADGNLSFVDGGVIGTGTNSSNAFVWKRVGNITL